MTPEIPDDEYVCFYPMSKRRGEEYNWYDLFGPRRPHGRPRRGRQGVRRQDQAGDRLLRRLRQPRVGRYPVRLGPDRHQGHRLRDALRPRLLAIRRVRRVLHRSPVPARGSGRVLRAGETVPTPAGDGDTGDTEDGHGHAHGEGHDHAGSGGGSAHGDHPGGEEETSGEGDHPHSGEGGRTRRRGW